MSVTFYSEYYYKGHQIILTDINNEDRIDLKMLTQIKSVKNNSDYIIRFYQIKELCIVTVFYQTFLNQ